jgi:hypothetical protein
MQQDMTPEQRATLWDFATEHLPEFTSVLLDQFHAAQADDDIRQQDRLTGATFLFLTLMNALSDDPILDESQTALSFPVPKRVRSFPAFGKLHKLN